MNYSKETYQFAHDLIVHYAKYDRHTKSYHIHVGNITPCELYELASLIMKSDENYASEATSFDNPLYKQIMLPVLTSYLKDTSNRENETNFNHVWRSCVTKYFYKSMQEVLNIECESYSYQRKYA